MSDLSLLELIQAHRWSRLFSTTYALSLSFFEAIVLDRVIRQQITSCTVLADISGVRTAIDEVGSQGAGRQYDIEPVAVRNGCFHPKMVALLADDDAALAVGSGNLTFGGWGSNLECIEFLHPSFAPDAFTDTADFLEKLATTEQATHRAQDECIVVAGQLRARAKGSNGNPNIRVLHNLGSSILDQVEELASGMGGATRLAVASPFFDRTGLARLCERLHLDSAYVHSHDGGTVPGSAGTNWPRGSLPRVEAVRLKVLDEGKPRLLHAKMYEIVCRRGRVLISGSANVTTPALEERRNIELCIARILANRSGWNYVKSTPPEFTPAMEDHAADDRKNVAILSATLEGARLEGRLISSFPCGAVEVSWKDGFSWVPLGGTAVNARGAFRLQVVGGWQTFRGGQVLLRLSHESGAVAQGFVSLPDLREISRRLGTSAPHFFSFLLGKETPADVAVILDYIYQNPDWLPQRRDGGAPSESTEEDKSPSVDIEDLLNVQSSDRAGHDRSTGRWQGWQRFMEEIFSVFRESNGVLENARPNRVNTDSSEADVEGESDEDEERSAADIIRALASFEKLLDRMLDGPREARHLIKALTIAQYVCEKLETEAFQVRRYLERILEAFANTAHGEEERNFYAAAALLWAVQLDGEFSNSAMQLRRHLLRAGLLPLSTDMPDLTALHGFRDKLAKRFQLEKVWQTAISSRTIQEEARAFWNTDGGPLDSQNFPLLSGLDPEWQTLKDGPSERIHRLRHFIDYCPKTQIGLPQIRVNRLRQNSVATCTCGRVLLCEEL